MLSLYRAGELVQCTHTLGHYLHYVNSYWYIAPMKAVQLRMARAAIRWGVRELAKKAGVAPNTVTRIENGADAKQSTMDKLQRILEAAGVEFTNGDQPGLRLTKTAAVRAEESGDPSRVTVGAKSGRSKTTKVTTKKR